MERYLNSQYSPEGLTCAINIFNFPEEFKERPRLRVLAFRYLFQYGHNMSKYSPTETKLLNQMKQMFQEMLRTHRTHQHAYEIADILSTHIPIEGNILLNRIRTIEDDYDVPLTSTRLGTRLGTRLHTQIPNRVRVDRNKPKVTKTVYNDSQNVHNTKINQSVLKIAKKLVNQYSDLLKLDNCNDMLQNIKNILLNKYPSHSNDIMESIKYIQESTATFGVGITLQDTFKAVWLWIHDSEHITELEKRFVEEIKEMKGYCTTGHLARLVNVVQGFTEDDTLTIKISEKDQCIAVVKTFLNKKLKDCNDENVIEQIIDGGEDYKKFIRESIKEKLLDWIDEYGKDILKYLPTVVNNFANTEIFKTI